VAKREAPKSGAARAIEQASSSGAPSALEIRERRENNIGRLLLRAYRAFGALATEKLRARGHEGLGITHTSLLPHITIEGTRLTTIAKLAGMTKQAAAEVLRDLEEQGYLERVVDPQDQRAVLVRFTREGWRFLRDAYETKVEIEEEYASILGSGTRSLDELRRALSAIIAHGAQDHEKPVTPKKRKGSVSQ